MNILGIETSCDETAISIIETDGKIGENFSIKILANEVLSQISLHQKYGGVFPALAKREHAKNLVPLFKQALITAGFFKKRNKKTAGLTIPKNPNIDFKHEPELWEQFEKEIPDIEKPSLDTIAITRGPGLEPTLWTGINFAKALSTAWPENEPIPLMPINHMEGHIFAALLRQKIDKKETAELETYSLQSIEFPAVALLVSGGHTELVLIKNWFDYKILGSTLDDAAGEAFDKVARIIGLPYPGGPEISKLAENWRKSGKKGLGIIFPRPMIDSKNYDFSFSGLKTSVLYFVKKQPEITTDLRAEIAAAFEDAAVESLTAKTGKALDESGAKTLIVGGGVAANKKLREELDKLAKRKNADLLISEIPYSTDNALMIALAAAGRLAFGKTANQSNFVADGNWKIDN